MAEFIPYVYRGEITKFISKNTLEKFLKEGFQLGRTKI
jgi:hypothetical protein